jgi:AcrR family transcriptional regulator
VTRRASPGDWCAAGLVLLREEGIGAVTVERLCAALGKTKGSFYHHFRDLDAYLVALLARWEEDLTDAVMREAATEEDPRRRGARLDAVVRGLDHRLDVAVRAWGLRDLRVRTALERVDERRIEYLADLHRSSRLPDARIAAELEYAAFVGAQQLGLFAKPARAERLSATFRSALAALARRRRTARRSAEERTSR